MAIITVKGEEKSPNVFEQHYFFNGVELVGAKNITVDKFMNLAINFDVKEIKEIKEDKGFVIDLEIEV